MEIQEADGLIAESGSRPQSHGPFLFIHIGSLHSGSAHKQAPQERQGILQVPELKVLSQKNDSDKRGACLQDSAWGAAGYRLGLGLRCSHWDHPPTYFPKCTIFHTREPRDLGNASEIQ